MKPHYYDDFKCAADKCPDTCCAGWQILIDEEAMLRYGSERGSFGSRLANSIDWREEAFLQYGGKCVFLNEQNLCDMVTEKGEDYLCETCQRYPRHVEEFEDLREWSLSLSCPVAAEMILNCREPVRFLVEEDEETDPLEEFDDFDLLLFTKLEDAREIIFRIAQDRTTVMEKRMERILTLAEQLQECLDEDRIYEMDRVLRIFDEKLQKDDSEYGFFRKIKIQCKGENIEEDISEKRFEYLKEEFAVFYRMERLRDQWGDVIDAAWSTLYAGDYGQYNSIYSAFMVEYGEGGASHKEWERFQENLLMFFLYTYFCGAVYDGWIYSKAAMAVFSVCFLQEFVMCRWYLSDKTITFAEWTELAYRYAREVEHSDDNLNLLEEWLQRKHQGEL